jgi:hypothetical protein
MEKTASNLEPRRSQKRSGSISGTPISLGKMMPMKATRFTAVTDARITIKSAIDFVLQSEPFYSHYFVKSHVRE